MEDSDQIEKRGEMTYDMIMIWCGVWCDVSGVSRFGGCHYGIVEIRTSHSFGGMSMRCVTSQWGEGEVEKERPAGCGDAEVKGADGGDTCVVLEAVSEVGGEVGGAFENRQWLMDWFTGEFSAKCFFLRSLGRPFKVGVWRTGRLGSRRW